MRLKIENEQLMLKAENNDNWFSVDRINKFLISMSNKYSLHLRVATMRVLKTYYANVILILEDEEKIVILDYLKQQEQRREN